MGNSVTLTFIRCGQRSLWKQKTHFGRFGDENHWLIRWYQGEIELEEQTEAKLEAYV